MNTTELRAWIGAKTGTTPTQRDLADLLDLGSSTVKRRDADGYRATEIVDAARAYNVNPVSALMDLGVVTIAEVLEAAGPGQLDRASDYDLAHALEERLRPAIPQIMPPAPMPPYSLGNLTGKTGLTAERLPHWGAHRDPADEYDLAASQDDTAEYQDFDNEDRSQDDYDHR